MSLGRTTHRLTKDRGPMGAKEHFARMRALRKGGWLSRLNINEAAMWLVYEEFADNDGVSRPGGAFIAEAIGHANDNNIARIRKILVGYGLIEIVEQGWGRGNPTAVKMLIPLPKQRSLFPTIKPLNSEGLRDELKPLNSEGESETKTPQTDELKPLKSETKTPQTERAHNKEDQLNTSANSSLAIPRRGADLGDADSVDPILQLDGWELSGLSAELSTREFRTAFAVWVIERRAKKKPLTAMMCRMQISFCAKIGHDAAIEAIEFSVRQGYDGICQERKGQNGQRKQGSEISCENLKL